MTERYEDIIHRGKVVGRRIVTDPVPEPLNPHIPREEFMERFTPREWRALKVGAQQFPELEQRLDLLLMMQIVDVSSPRIIAFVERLGVAAPDLFTAERIAAILAPNSSRDG